MGNSLVPMASKRCCGLTMGRVRRLEFVSDQCSTRLQKTVFAFVFALVDFVQVEWVVGERLELL